VKIWSDLEIVTKTKVANKTISITLEEHEAIVMDAALSALLNDPVWEKAFDSSVRDLTRFLRCAELMQGAIHERLVAVGVVRDGEPT
jgi:hypothetical protein